MRQYLYFTDEEVEVYKDEMSFSQVIMLVIVGLSFKHKCPNESVTIMHCGLLINDDDFLIYT